MNKITMKFLTLIGGIFFASFQALAWEVNVDVDINTTTNYRDCQEYADDIVELVKLFIKPESDDHRSFIDEQITFLKKQLKSCEGMNKESGNRKNADVKLSIGHNFSS